MLPDHGQHSLNLLVNRLNEYAVVRDSLHDLHRQLARGTFSRLGQGTPERLLAESMCLSFFYEFDQADETIDLALERFPLDPVYVRNLQKVLSDSFRLTDLLTFVRRQITSFQDDLPYLGVTRALMVRNGFFETADQITQMLAKLGHRPEDSHYTQAMLSAVQSYGLSDEAIANFLECGLKPLREFLQPNPTITFARSVEHVVEEPPELLAFTVYMGGSFEQLMQVSEASLLAVSEGNFDEAVDRRLVISFNDLNFELEEPDAAPAIS